MGSRDGVGGERAGKRMRLAGLGWPYHSALPAELRSFSKSQAGYWKVLSHRTTASAVPWKDSYSWLLGQE